MLHSTKVRVRTVHRHPLRPVQRSGEARGHRGGHFTPVIILNTVSQQSSQFPLFSKVFGGILCTISNSFNRQYYCVQSSFSQGHKEYIWSSNVHYVKPYTCLVPFTQISRLGGTLIRREHTLSGEIGLLHRRTPVFKDPDKDETVRRPRLLRSWQRSRLRVLITYRCRSLSAGGLCLSYKERVSFVCVKFLLLVPPSCQ